MITLNSGGIKVEVKNKVIYTIFINKKQVFSVRNSAPTEFKNVKVFTASSWYSPLSGFIRNLVIENKNEGEPIRN